MQKNTYVKTFPNVKSLQIHLHIMTTASELEQSKMIPKISFPNLEHFKSHYQISGIYFNSFLFPVCHNIATLSLNIMTQKDRVWVVNNLLKISNVEKLAIGGRCFPTATRPSSNDHDFEKIRAKYECGRYNKVLSKITNGYSNYTINEMKLWILEKIASWMITVNDNEYFLDEDLIKNWPE